MTPPTWPPRWVSLIVRGRWCRLTMLSPSTNTRLRFGSTRRTLPVLPESFPEITCTTSSRRIFMPISEDLRCQRDDLHEIALAQLPRYRSEDAGAARIVGGIDQDGGILVERDERAVPPAELLASADHDCLDDLALLDRALRRGALDGPDDDVADARVTAPGTSLDADAE